MKRFKCHCRITVYRLLRFLERILPVSLLLMVCIPLASVIAVFCCSKKLTTKECYHIYMNKFLLAFSKRLAEEKWLQRCDIDISDDLSEDIKAKRPIVFLFIHRGEFKILPYWLRTIGIRASVIMKSKASRRKLNRLWRDKRDLFPEQKVVWGRDELKNFIQLLDKGGALVMAVDTNLGKLESVTFDDGREVKIASGPFRISEKHHCAVYPCGLENTSEWKFKLRVGKRYSGDKATLMEDLYACHTS